jgi:hypothetical protein
VFYAKRGIMPLTNKAAGTARGGPTTANDFTVLQLFIKGIIPAKTAKND